MEKFKKWVSDKFKVTFDNFFLRVGKWSEMVGDGHPGCRGREKWPGFRGAKRLKSRGIQGSLADRPAKQVA